MRRAHRRPRVLVLCGLVLAGSTTSMVPGPASRPAQAAEATASAVTVAWTPRNPADRTEEAVYDALKDWRLTVSQTRDLLNQTVEVSWAGAKTLDTAPFVQLMQCWSAGPDVEPTREQCAYGGVEAEAASTSGSLRTRALSRDPRETEYRNDGDLNLVTVDGGTPPRSWGDPASLVLGTSQQTCPAGTVGYTVTMVPPRSGSLPPAVVLEGPTRTPPASLTRQEGQSTRTYASVTGAFTLADAAGKAGVQRLAIGTYRFQLACNDAAGVERTRFVGYLERALINGSEAWRRIFRAGGVSVPFDPVGDTPDTGPTDPYVAEEVLEYVKPRSSNEIFQAKARPDGRGSVIMEQLTDLEAQHLACGRVDDGRARSCWVVAVPRWAPEPAASTAANPFSPLSQTLWDRRIAVPLGFAPVAAGCTIGSGLKQILAHDSALLALRSWQPTFCGKASTATSILGPLSDDSIRAGVDQPNRMGIVTVPDGAAGGTVVRAPVATSGVVIGFAVDRQLPLGSPKYDLNETRTEVLNLDARLVAKLLSQSYDAGAAPNGGKTGGRPATYLPARRFPSGNPRTIYQDPEFLRLNPDFQSWLAEGASLPGNQMADVLVSANDADAYRILWQWVLGDPDARAFLDGKADPDGMLVNPYYKGQLTAQTSSFPQLDPTCADIFQEKEADAFPLLCQINIHPRVDNDTRAAQAAIRGDTKRVNLPPQVITGGPGEILTYSAEPRQQPGQLAMLVVTTSAVAERYGLATARLRNSQGQLVPATADAMSRARQQMKPRADGVLVADPASVRDGGYPLTTNSYALVDVAATTAAQNAAFATILDYAAGDGQRAGTAVGQLPPGYAPLSPAMAGQTRAAAALLRNPASLLPAPSASPSPAPVDPAGGSDPGDVVDPVPAAGSAGPGGNAGASNGDPGAAGSGSAADGGAIGSSAPGPQATAPAPSGPGPVIAGDAPPARQLARAVATSGASSPLRWTVPLLLLLGLVCAAGGRVLPVLGRPRAS